MSPDRKRRPGSWNFTSTPTNDEQSLPHAAEEDKRMNISKKLYLNFGIILTMVLVLLAVNLIAVFREHETKAAAKQSLEMTEATSAVRFQLMQNRLHLQNYLLS